MPDVCTPAGVTRALIPLHNLHRHFAQDVAVPTKLEYIPVGYEALRPSLDIADRASTARCFESRDLTLEPLLVLCYSQ